MSRLLDLYAMTPPGMVFLFGVLFIVYAFMLWKLMGMYYGKSFTRAAEAMRKEYCKALENYKRGRDGARKPNEWGAQSH